MRPARAKLKRFQDMLLDEARLVARIAHPNVAQIWEVDEDPRSIYVVMELVDGAPLDVLRDRAEEIGRPLPLGAVFRVLADVCGGLHAAHELTGDDGAPLGLVHRDVSPQNILVSRHGTAKLIDFGIAKAKERLGADTKSGFIKGKISFMAPEQARAEEVDRRADVWAVGAVAYDLLAGHPPVEAPSDLARLAVLGGPDPIPPLDEAVPAPLRVVVARALEKDRAARFPTAAAMKDAIEEALVACEHETTADEAGRLLAPFFLEAPASRRGEPSVVPASGGRPGARDGGTGDGDEAPAGASVERAVSSTIDARLVDGSMEIPVHRTRLWPIGVGAVLAGGLAWWALTPSSSPPQPGPVAPDGAPQATPRAAARTGEPGSPRAPLGPPSSRPAASAAASEQPPAPLPAPPPPRVPSPRPSVAPAASPPAPPIAGPAAPSVARPPGPSVARPPAPPPTPTVDEHAIE
jgi:serine/threonine-protein kinase